MDLERATLEILSQRTVDAEWNVVVKEPKGTSRRTLDLGAGAVAALRDHVARTAAERGTAGTGWQESGLVFVDALGRPYHPDRFTRMLKRPRFDAASF